MPVRRFVSKTLVTEEGRFPKLRVPEEEENVLLCGCI